METPSLVQDGIDNAERRVRRLRQDGRKAVKQAQRRRRSLEKNLNSRVRRLREDAEALRDRVVEQVGDVFDTLLSPLPVATKADVAKMDRKVKTLSRKLAKVQQGRGRRRRVA